MSCDVRGEMLGDFRQIRNLLEICVDFLVGHHRQHDPFRQHGGVVLVFAHYLLRNIE